MFIYSVELVGTYPNHIELIKRVYRMLFHSCGLGSSMGNHFQLYYYIHFWVKCAKI